MSFEKLRTHYKIWGLNSVAMHCSGENPYFLWSSAERHMAFWKEVILNLDRLHELNFLSYHLVLKFTIG